MTATSKIPSTFLVQNRVPQFISVSATLAEINAGKVLIPPSQRTIQLISIHLLVAGTFAALTDIRLSDITAAGATANDILTMVAAQLGDGLVHSHLTGTNVLGAAFWASLVAGSGLQVRKTGATGTGGTTIKFNIVFVYTN